MFLVGSGGDLQGRKQLHGALEREGSGTVRLHRMKGEDPLLGNRPGASTCARGFKSPHQAFFRYAQPALQLHGPKKRQGRILALAFAVQEHARFLSLSIAKIGLGSIARPNPGGLVIDQGT